MTGIDDTLKDIDKIGEALEKKLGKEKLGKMLKKIKRKPIYQLYDTYTTSWQVCKVCHGLDTFTCKSGKEMEAHIRAKHNDLLTDVWRTKF